MHLQGEKYNIICLSNQLWDYPLWTNKKHVMTRLEKLGHNVLFVDPPINTGRLFMRQILQGKWSPLKLLTKTQKMGNVLVFSPLDFSPAHEKHAELHAKAIQNATKKFWIYHVEIAGLDQYLKYIEHDFLVYDCVDNYAGFPKYSTPEKKDAINKKEQGLAMRANVVFSTAPGLVEKLKKFNSNVYFTPNVGDYPKFFDIKARIRNYPEDIKSIPHPIVGFYGAVDNYKFDRELMKKIVTDYPKYSFVIIGPIALKDREGSLEELGLGGLPNLHYLGTKPFSEIHNYVAAFDATIIPYRLNDYTVGGCFPVKFHEGLAAGLPTIVTDLPAYAPFADVCYIAKSYNEFSQFDSLERRMARQKVAKSNDWDGKVERMLRIIGDLLKK
ncbi:MAG: Glycosyl transferase group 1 [candidate division WWE3 bacterium GW2011_GWE1_41_27]|uniref:Glycosyl transferase group 1 n=1 Tax=candidate division WWE3 bacterium GW2011_GWE1_41_27 TaxID=1619131 RepID=A0A0G0W632_UNCKA|nr:MAG: Glycosyl transferase group 1 [candidate division WWE3 bacterium GW2011_GWE1_41_27]